MRPCRFTNYFTFRIRKNLKIGNSLMKFNRLRIVHNCSHFYKNLKITYLSLQLSPLLVWLKRSIVRQYIYLLLKFIQMQYRDKGQDPAYDNKTPSWQGHMYRNQAGKDRSQLWRQTVSNWGRSVCLPSRRADKHEAIETRTDTARHTGREIQSKTTYKLKKQRNKGTKKEGTTTRQIDLTYVLLHPCSTPTVCSS